ncbi:MAG: hypothetical protein BWX48_00136 [Verrucomicrobia bacterium ADurb.Bin006]|jgi:hypothetical protein|nr:MAG: hypothetical protein BWX48_00136 [Verrucomicrobia bacterium ADurb.Bin006]
MGTELFANLTAEEKRAALDFDEFYLRSILDARQGTAHVVEVGFSNKFVKGSVPESRNVDWTITSSGRGGRTSKG